VLQRRVKVVLPPRRVPPVKLLRLLRRRLRLLLLPPLELHRTQPPSLPRLLLPLRVTLPLLAMLKALLPVTFKTSQASLQASKTAPPRSKMAVVPHSTASEWIRLSGSWIGMDLY
jgi:hypothetical protein